MASGIRNMGFGLYIYSIGGGRERNKVEKFELENAHFVSQKTF